MYHNLVQWTCDHLWRIVDSQDQYLGIQLDITNACNLACKHCYHDHHKNIGALTYEQWLFVLDEYQNLLKRLCMKPRITLCGGEPIVCPFLIPLIGEIRKRFPACRVMLLSNGTLVTQETCKMLKQADVHVQISMDGPDVERHDMIRGVGSFARTLKGCQLLKNYDVKFNHLAVLSKRTSSWIPDFFSLPDKTGASEMNFVRLVSEGHARMMLNSGADAPLSGNELKVAYTEIHKCSQQSGVPTVTEGPLWCLIDEKLGAANSIGMTGFVIGYRGEFKVSSRVSAVLGNVLKDSMADLFLHHSTMQKLRKGDIEVCGKCRFYKRCRGDRNVSYATYGHFFGPDPGCWILNEVDRGHHL
jgi:MoaA/NifB/PqqE/SkfB family radical SAM enzyme